MVALALALTRVALDSARVAGGAVGVDDDADVTPPEGAQHQGSTCGHTMRQDDDSASEDEDNGGEPATLQSQIQHEMDLFRRLRKKPMPLSQKAMMTKPAFFAGGGITVLRAIPMFPVLQGLLWL